MTARKRRRLARIAARNAMEAQIYRDGVAVRAEAWRGECGPSCRCDFGMDPVRGPDGTSRARGRNLRQQKRRAEKNTRDLAREWRREQRKTCAMSSRTRRRIDRELAAEAAAWERETFADGPF